MAEAVQPKVQAADLSTEKDSGGCWVLRGMSLPGFLLAAILIFLQKVV
jgi:hypothetical protein